MQPALKRNRYLQYGNKTPQFYSVPLDTNLVNFHLPRIVTIHYPNMHFNVYRLIYSVFYLTHVQVVFLPTFCTHLNSPTHPAAASSPILVTTIPLLTMQNGLS